MYIPKFRHKLLLFVCLSVVALGIVALADALIRPVNPTMDYVPQNIGIYDTYYDNFKESDCRVCHGASTSTRHHNSEWALDGNCLYCHNEFPVVIPPERNCKVCHNDAWTKHPNQYGLPHHNTDWADSDQCTRCHDSNLLCETNTCAVPTQYPDPGITPTPFACENCHWPSGQTPHQAETYPDQGAPGTADEVAEFLTDWLTWGGTPKPTTYPTGDDPQPIEANGKVKVAIWTLWDGTGAAGANNRFGVFMPDKPFMPSWSPDSTIGTHHEVRADVFPKCFNCHATNPDTDVSYDPTNPYLIRMCENCHDIGTLHGIAEHVTTNNIYMVGGVGLQTVTDNNKCVACHGDNMVGAPARPATMPVIKRITPNQGGAPGVVSFGSTGLRMSIFPTVAQDFGPGGLSDNGVELSGLDTGNNPNVVDADIIEWQPAEIVFKIPGWEFKSGQNISVRVRMRKANGVIGYTLPVSTDLNKHPDVTSIVDSTGDATGPVGEIVTLKGKGLGLASYGVGNNEVVHPLDTGINKRWGQATYVELRNSNDKYRVTQYLPAGTYNMSGNKIKFQLDKLYDINTGQQVPADQLYPTPTGCWTVYVRTDYFLDGNQNGNYFKASGALESEVAGGSTDTLLFYEESDPVCYVVNEGPYITSVSPALQKKGKYAALYGVNFGIAPGKILVKTLAGASAATVGSFIAPASWSDTEIVFKVPAVTPYGVKYYLQVKSATGLKGNKVKLKILAP